MCSRLARGQPGCGYEVKELVKHANPTRDFNNFVLRMKSLNTDIVIQATGRKSDARVASVMGLRRAKGQAQKLIAQLR